MYSEIYAKDLYVYDVRGKRDPFVPLVITARAISSLEDVVSIEDVRFQGIAIDAAGKRIAVLNGEMIKEGETVGLVTVKKILEDRVILLIDEERHILVIYKEIQ